MAEGDVQLAVEWMKDPSQCAEFLDGLIQEFEYLYVRVETPPNSDGESLLILKKTTTYRGQGVAKY
jgi:hypothetical protein